MEQLNSLSKVLRHDGSYFYIKQLSLKNGLYKYMLADWEWKKLGKPIIIYSHTKRSSLSRLDKEYFDNNLLNKKRINKYINNNLYIGGIKRINDKPVRELREGLKVEPNYKTYIRDNNYILIELIKDGTLKKYNIYEFINRKTIIDFEISIIYSEKDLLNMNDETDYVINKLLDSKRIEKKMETANGYVGTVELINGEYKKIANTVSQLKVNALENC